MGWFGKKKAAAFPSFSPEVTAVLERIRAFVEDEAAQNARNSEPLRSRILANPRIDMVRGGTGEFGRSYNNPIPVNGAIGEIFYLSRLQTESAQPLLFHRLGSIDFVDVYETVALDGRSWDVLFLSMYYAGKSRLAPSGYKVVDLRTQPLIYGVNARVPAFSFDLPEEVGEVTRLILGVAMQPREIRIALGSVPFVRPRHHQELLDAVTPNITGWRPGVAESRSPPSSRQIDGD